MATQEVHHVALTLTDHLPILQVLVPFVAAPLVVVLGSRSLAWPIAFAASAISFVIAILLLHAYVRVYGVTQTPPKSYTM